MNLSSNAIYANQPIPSAKIEKTNIQEFIQVKPLDLVNNPENYLNKNIKMYAQFNKFSTLGLDYDKAMRSSKDYISILIKRPDVAEQYTIPLSELKLFVKRGEAEKLLDMKNGDKIEITGKVFSTALNDPWVDAYTFKSLEPEQKKEITKETGK